MARHRDDRSQRPDLDREADLQRGFNQFRVWNGVAGLDVTANILAPLGSSNPGTSGYANNGELQWYVNPDYRPPGGSPTLPNPFSTQDGVLTIAARPADAAVRSTIGGQTYTSGVVSTYHEFSQTFGYFEMRAELPAGKGLWPAFWLMPADGSWPPEIDVMEQLGKDPGTIYTTVHSKVAGREQIAGAHFQTTAGASVADTSRGFHTCGVDWEPDAITWFFDGREIYRAPTPADAGKPMYMIANLAVGGTWPGQPDGSTTFPADMMIDYLRAYSARPAAATQAATPQVRAPCRSRSRRMPMERTRSSWSGWTASRSAASRRPMPATPPARGTV